MTEEYEEEYYEGDWRQDCNVIGDWNTEDDYHFSETILWNARNEIDPPYKGYIMFASSCADENVPHLVNEYGIDPADIAVVYISGHETVWYKPEE